MGVATAAAVVVAAILGGCDGALNPEGPRAEDLARSWWLMFVMGTIVYVFVLAVLAVALFRRRRSDDDSDPLDGVDRRSGSTMREQGEVGEDEQDAAAPDMTKLLVGGGVILPAVVIVVLVAATVFVGRAAVMERDGELEIEIVGHQFWWSVIYPGSGAVTANEVNIPTGQPVVLKLTSQDVIHSFWVPELAGKTDLVPGRTNELRFEADRPGSYQGVCAEFCGLAHTEMRLRVIAHEPDDFDDWLERQLVDAPFPEDDEALEGMQVFLGSSCVYCHTVRGTNATGTTGPDLTTLASRETIGAGFLEYNLGNLAGWILDPQQLKPGSAMPATALDPDELQALITYLDTLR